MTRKYLEQLDNAQFEDLLKTLDFPTYQTGFKQGTKKLDMTEGSIGLFSYNFTDERILYIKDFKVKHSHKRKLPNELPVDRKRTAALFVFLIEKFDDYYENAKKYWKEDPFILRILDKARRKAELIKRENYKTTEVKDDVEIYDK